MERIARRSLLRSVGIGGVIGLAGCVGPADPQEVAGGPLDESDFRGFENGSPPEIDDANPPTADRQLPVPYEFETLREETRSGAPKKDWIPSIDEPAFVDAAGGDEFLDPGDVVFGVAGEEDVKAYPQPILVHHEIANDTLDGVPVSVTYCPLTGTVLGFKRGDTTFGVSGDLVNNNLVMYDRNSDSRWPQILGTAIEGFFEGRSLREFRLIWTTWEQWRDRHPDTQVLSEDTGYARNYNSDPYGKYNPAGGYYAQESTLFPPLREDDRYHPKEVVMGARVPAGAMAFHKKSLADAGTLEGTLDGVTYTAVYDEGLGTAYVYRNPDEVTVEDLEEEPAAFPLDRVHTFDAMWFAWSGLYPDTEVYA